MALGSGEVGDLGFLGGDDIGNVISEERGGLVGLDGLAWHLLGVGILLLKVLQLNDDEPVRFGCLFQLVSEHICCFRCLCFSLSAQEKLVLKLAARSLHLGNALL